MQNKSTRSILSEMEMYLPQKNKHHIVESRASHIIASSINLLELIKENYTEEQAIEMEKRLLSAIRTRNPKKFNTIIESLKKNVN